MSYLPDEEENLQNKDNRPEGMENQDSHDVDETGRERLGVSSGDAEFRESVRVIVMSKNHLT